MTNTRECLNNADECFRIGRSYGTSKRRNILFDMGRTWETLAKNKSKSNRRKPPTEAP
jgi:hypothetical protein